MYDHLHHDFSPKHWLQAWNEPSYLEQFMDFFNLEALGGVFYSLLSDTAGNFLALQWLGLHTSTAWGPGLIPSWRMKTLQAAVKKEKSKCHSLSHVWLFPTPWTVARQAALSMEFSRQEYLSGLPFPSPRDLSDPGIKPTSSAFFTTELPGITK